MLIKWFHAISAKILMNICIHIQLQQQVEPAFSDIAISSWITAATKSEKHTSRAHQINIFSFRCIFKWRTVHMVNFSSDWNSIYGAVRCNVWQHKIIDRDRVTATNKETEKFICTKQTTLLIFYRCTI